MPVVVVEEPKWGYQNSDICIGHDRGVTVVTPLMAGSPPAPGFGGHVNAEISRLLAQVVPPGSDPICWYYTPMALGAEPAGSRPVLRVYDAMDDLASFLGAPPELRDNERRLLAQVDLVFTGGPTLYRARRDKHRAVHCFPSGVEGAHFAPGSFALVRPADLTTRPRPILGYYGVIDERLDLPLLAAIADAQPDWTIALVGPVAKIDERTIPVRSNIVRFGQQAYRDLPAFLAAFDIALMPFARNDATQAISPTKTLEYLAGEKPVISTPITDVIDLYGDVVEIAATAPEFIAAAEALLSRTGAEDRRWRARAAHLVAANDWDVIATDMLDVMARARVTRSLPLIDQSAVALTA
jgi:glycosyltransferase involved in cell wall biosynthesis